MKLQTLTVIFIIIMLPITMVVSQFIKTEINTINMQTNYDTKLTNATYDALKAFQLNESNSTTSNITTEKIRDVKASINSFYSSLASSMGVAGYSEEDLNSYIPCLIYTLYDGYYIYTKNSETGSYELKPYVYYTEHFNEGGASITISYTLDSYIMITKTAYNSLTGKYETETKSGYLYSGDEKNDTEKLAENIVYDGQIYNDIPYVYKKFSGQSIKYYHADFNNDEVPEWYSYGTDGKLKKETNKTYLYGELNGVKGLNITEVEDHSYENYTKDGKNFSEWVNNNICSLNSNNLGFLDVTKKGNDPDKYSSEFNEHRRTVIENSIKSNMEATLIAYRGNGTFDFKMPELDETEWDKIINNVCLISFMQGFPLKNKLYRGYSVVTNTQSKEFVDPDEIYLIQDGQYHKIIWKGFKDESVGLVAYRNIDFKPRSYYYVDDMTEEYEQRDYLPHEETACYGSIISNSDTIEENDQTEDETEEALENLTNRINEIYYKALYRERYANYKSLNFGT